MPFAMRKYPTFILFILLLIVMQTGWDACAMSFRKIRINNGLSHDHVSCLLQDSLGFVWIGTSNGLNCYYGNSNKVFRSDDERSINLPSNQIISLFDAAPDSLWIGTSRGLSLYNRFTGSFTPFDVRTAYGVRVSCEVCCLLRGTDGAIWIGTLGQGLFRYDGQRLEQFLSETSFATALAVDIAGNLYVASMGHEVLVYTSQGRLKTVIPMPSAVRCLYYSPQGVLYAGLDDCIVSLERGGQKSYHVANVQCITGDSDGNLFVGTARGLYMLSAGADRLERVDDISANGGLSSPEVTALMIDREGGTWIGTGGGGVNYVTAQSHAFRSHRLPDNSIKETVAALCEAPDNTLYIGTERGLYVLPEGHSTVQRSALADGDIRGICAFWLEGDRLWMGTLQKGLFCLDTRTCRVQSFALQPGMSGRVSCVWRGSNGRLYIGTDNGLWHLNADNGIFEQDHTLGFMILVEDMCEDSLQNLWIATSQDGIYRHTLHNGHWRHYRRNPKQGEGKLFSDNVNALKIDRNGRLWIGTDGNGLGLYDPVSDTFVRYEDGALQNEESATHVIRGIEQDCQGNLWTIDGQGLSRYYVESDTVGVRTWNVNGGLPISNLGAHAALCLSDGRMAFGGEGGLTLFDPQELKPKHSVATTVHVIGIDFPYEQPEDASEDTSDYGLMVSLPEELELPYVCNSFQLTFSSTCYESPEKTLYRYRFGKDTQVSTQPAPVDVASFTDLVPGTYHLCVEAANADGIWSRYPAEMTIIIRPPWWLGTAARIAYVLLGLGIVACAAWAWNAHVKRKYRNRMKQAEAVRQEEAYRQKINFFVNLVHEIRTPLSLIRLPLEQIRESGEQNEENSRLLSLVDKNVDYLLNVSNQLLDLQKLENGDNFLLHLETCDVGVLTDNLQIQFADTACLRGVSFTVERPEGPLEASIDRDKVYKILVNLCSNALKYARSRIIVNLTTETDGTLCWMVDDDGPGIPPEERQNIFKTFYRIENGTTAPVGTGIGLSYAQALAVRHGGELHVADSPLGGARFVLSVPLQPDAVQNDRQPLSAEQSAMMPDTSPDELSQREFCVLVVEDNTELLKLTTHSLSKWFRTRRAVNGQQALELLNADGCDVDVVVSDVMMPVMDGLELCRRVKQDVNTSHLPFVMLTAKTTLEAKTDGLSCGADAYVEKPFSIRQLKAQIENLLRLRQAFHLRMNSVEQSPLSEDVQQEFSAVLNECDREFVERLDQLIQERISDENLSIDCLCADMNMSRSNLYRKIRALTGMSPTDYLKWVRLNKAAELLRQGKRVSDVYLEVGFNSSSYFAKCFKNRFGVIPREYLSSLGTSANGRKE